MAKYRPVYPSQYGSRYVLEAPNEFQERIDQIDPGFFWGDLQFDEGFGNIGPETDLGDFMGAFHGQDGWYTAPDGTKWKRNPDGTMCGAEQDKKTGKWTVACGPMVSFTPRSGTTKPRIVKF